MTDNQKINIAYIRPVRLKTGNLPRAYWYYGELFLCISRGEKLCEFMVLWHYIAGSRGKLRPKPLSVERTQPIRRVNILSEIFENGQSQAARQMSNSLGSNVLVHWWNQMTQKNNSEMKIFLTCDEVVAISCEKWPVWRFAVHRRKHQKLLMILIIRHLPYNSISSNNHVAKSSLT